MSTKRICFVILFICLTTTLFAIGKQKEQYYIVLENVQDYASLKLQQELNELSQSFDMELHVRSTTNYGDSKIIINDALSNKLPIITYQGIIQENLPEIFKIAKDKITVSHNSYFFSFLLLNTPLPAGTHFPLPWAFVGIDTKKMAQNILKKISNKISATSLIIVYTPNIQQNCKLINDSITLENFVKDHVNAKTNTSEVSKNKALYNESLSHSVYMQLKKEHKKTENTAVSCYNRVHSYIKTNMLFDQNKALPDVIIALNDEVAIGIVEAYKAANKVIPLIVAYGGSPEIRRYINSGDVLASIEPDYKIYAEKIINVIESFFFTYAGVEYPRNKALSYPAKYIYYVPFHFVE